MAKLKACCFSLPPNSCPQTLTLRKYGAQGVKLRDRRLSSAHLYPDFSKLDSSHKQSTSFLLCHRKDAQVPIWTKSIHGILNLDLQSALMVTSFDNHLLTEN